MHSNNRIDVAIKHNLWSKIILVILGKNCYLYNHQGWGQVQYLYLVLVRVGVKYSTCTWYLYLSTYLSVLDVLEYLVYGNVKVLVLDQKVTGTYK